MDTFVKKVLAIAAGTLALTSIAFAQPKPNVFDGGNLWELTGYYDNAGDHRQAATHQICFLPYAVSGTGIEGAWYSLTFPDWNGRYYQEGDELKMTGDYAEDVGHDHMTLLHTTYDVPEQVKAIAFKDWTEWREDGAYGRIIGWGNSMLVRVGKCKYPVEIDDTIEITPELIKELEAKAIDFSLQLPPRLTVKGDIARYPAQDDLESVYEYLKRSGF